MDPTSPSKPDENRTPRPMPCPGCESTKGFQRLGKFRSQCTNCNATFPNAEVGVDDQDPQ